MERTYGTLKELNVKPGDVVQWVDTEGNDMLDTVLSADVIEPGVMFAGMIRAEFLDYGIGIWDEEKLTLVSRASSGEGEESDERSEDETTPKTWGEMSDAEKGALLLAVHNGGIPERLYFDGWRECVANLVGHHDDEEYRIRPELSVEPKRETVTLYGQAGDFGFDFETGQAEGDTHKITFETVDGVPVLDSIKMEEVN